jgi:hypothetical protein
VIAYFDTSAVIPLLVDEPGSATAGRLWDEADHVVSVSLGYAEARAALAQAHRLRRLSATGLRRSVADLGELYSQIDRVAVSDDLVRRAGDLAERHALRGYDAVHLAAGLVVADAETVFVSGDHALRRAAHAAGLATVGLG